MKKKAESLFAERYFKRYEDDLYITYKYEKQKKIFIRFCKETHTVITSNVCIFTMNEIGAIALQLKELGWKVKM